MQIGTVVVQWRAGLHARCAAEIVKIANKFQSNITLKKDDNEADAKSIINILTLEASYKTALTIITDGQDEIEAIKAISEIFTKIVE